MAASKKPDKATGDGISSDRRDVVDGAVSRLRARSYYVDRYGPGGALAGRERSLVATYAPDGAGMFGISVSGRGDDIEVEVPGVIYHGNRGDVGAPVRFVLDRRDLVDLVLALQEITGPVEEK